jgi:hypothetical protein
VFHLELRQFPNNFCRFNLSESELRSQVLDAWVRGDWIELGERKWNPQQAKLTVIEGPELPLDQLTMGRGWRNAQRGGREVTAQILAESTERQAKSGGAGSGELEHVDSLALQIVSELGKCQIPLARAWELAGERNPSATASQSLALAEDAIEWLLHSGLIELLTGDADDESGLQRLENPEDVSAALKEVSNWAASVSPTGVWLRRL